MNNQQFKTHKPKLVMTDYFFLFGMWLVILWALDPFDLRLDFLGAGIKHFPLVFMSSVYFLVFISGVLFKKRTLSTTLKEIDENSNFNLIIWTFALFVTIGSLYARFASGIENGFLTMGLYAMTAPLTAWFIKRTSYPVALIKIIVFIYLFWALVSILMQVIKFGGAAVFHAREHLALASLAVLYFLAKSKKAKFTVAVFIAAAAFSGQKNTAYLVALLLFTFFFIVSGISYAKIIKDGFMRWMFWFRAFVIAFVAIASTGLAYLYVKSTLPTGNPEYRLHTYENAWNKFLSSPIWGNGYTRAATEEFDLFTVASSTQVLPTHSDPLDIIANGGLIGILLWASVFVVLLRRWFTLAFSPERLIEQSLLPYLHAFLCLVYTGVLVCAFNPILNSPNNAWAFWAPVGILMISLRFKEKVKQTDIKGKDEIKPI